MQKQSTHSILNVLGVIILLSLLFIGYSYPLILNWDSQVIGLDQATADSPHFLYSLYLFQSDLDAGHFGFTNQLFYPLGESTWLHGLSPGMGALYSLIGGNVFSFLNTFTLFCFLLSGVGAFFLARVYTKSYIGAVLVAFVFVFSSFHLAQWQDHYWYIINFTMPWYLLYFPRVFDFHARHKFLRIASYKYLFVCLVLGIISASLEYYTTFFLIYLSVFYALWKRYLSKINWHWIWWKKALTVLIAIIILSTIIDLLKNSGIDDKHGFYWSGDLAGLFIPQNNMLYGDAFDLFLGSWQEPGADEKNLFLGFTLILAFAIALFYYQKNQQENPSRSLLFATVFLLMLCFPVVKIFGHSLIKLPSAILHFIPFLNNIRVPTRWAILVYLFLPLFIVRVVDLNFEAKKRALIFAFILLATIAEYWPKTYHFFPEEDYVTEAELIKQQEGEVLLTLPFGVRDGYKQIGFQDNRYLYAQTIHHKKMIGGYLSRVSDTVFNYYQADPLCNSLMSLIENVEAPQQLPSQSGEFFKHFHPELLWIREDYLNHPALNLFKRACIENQIQLEQVSESLYLLRYR